MIKTIDAYCVGMTQLFALKGYKVERDAHFYKGSVGQ